jgi:aspartyl-tRNA(Asn)/glutamyl-tRNA(Gln) amidotransferase subunit C
MTLSREDVEKVASLARLQLAEDELSTITGQLGTIVEYIGQLNELNTEDIEPMGQALELANVFAPDVVAPSLDREAALGNAPNRDDECFRVPAVLGDGM